MTMKHKVPEGEDFLRHFSTLNDVPAEVLEKEKLTEGMFSSSYSSEIRHELKKCLRVMPHH